MHSLFDKSMSIAAFIASDRILSNSVAFLSVEGLSSAELGTVRKRIDGRQEKTILRLQ
jgi:hypothetical protein